MYIVQLNTSTRVILDAEAKCLRLEYFWIPIPGFRGQWRAQQTFSSQEEWNSTPYADMMSDDDYAAIAYFWLDNGQATEGLQQNSATQGG